MSNLGEIVGRVEHELAYSPDLLEYKRQIRALVSAEYAELCTERPWPWLHRTEPLLAFPDVTLTNAQLVRVGPRTFTIPGVALETAFYSILDQRAFEVYQDLLCGAELDLTDRSLRTAGTGNWTFSPFVIENVLTNAATVTLFLDPRCNITALAAGLGSYVIRSRRLRLPARCDAIVSIVDNDNRPLKPLPKELWNQYEQDPERTGSAPLHYMIDGGLDSGQPYVTGPTDPASAVNDTIRQVRNQPIYEDPPFVAVASAGGSLLADTTYRVRVCWTYGGRYGPPSGELSVTTAGANKTVALTGLPTAAAGAGTDTFGDTGRRIAVFVAEGNFGPWFLSGFLGTGFATTFNVTTRPTKQFEHMLLRRWEHVYPGGPYSYLRLWPRSDVQRRLLLTYVSKPVPLVADVDEPELPSTFHDVIVRRTILTMVARWGASIGFKQTQEALLARGLRAMHNRYLPGLPTRVQKGMFGAVPGPSPGFPAIIDVQD